MPITLERIPHHTQVAVKTLTLLNVPYRKIAKALEISTPTITQINRQVPADLDEITHFKNRMVAESYSIATRAAIRVTDEKLDACSAPQLAMVSGVFIDKARDIEGLNRAQINIVTVVGECRQTAAKLEREIHALDAILMPSGT
jgi:hypothetical protein